MKFREELEQDEVEHGENEVPKLPEVPKFEPRKVVRKRYNKGNKRYTAYTVDFRSVNHTIPIEKIVYRLPRWFKDRVREKSGIDSELRLSVWGSLNIEADVYAKGYESYPENHVIQLS